MIRRHVIPGTSLRACGVWLILLLAPMIGHAPEFVLSLSSDPLYFTSRLELAEPDGLLQGQPGWNDPNTGYTTQALGHLAARQLLHGELPWWNPYSGVGLPLAAEMQGSALFLPFVLLLINAATGIVYLKLCMQVIAGFATYQLLSQLGMTRRIALLGGILYELNGTFAWMGHAPIMPVPFLPLLLFGIERCLAHAQGQRSGGGAWVSVALAYSLYAGFPETAFIDGLMAAAWAGYRLATTKPGTRQRFAVKIAVGGLVGLMMAMPAVLPFLQFLAQAYSGPHGVQSFSFDPANYAMFLVPCIFGPIYFDYKWLIWGLAGGYVSLAVAGLATLALARQSREFGLRVMLTVWIALALAKSANVPVVSEVFDLIPFMREAWFSRYAPPSWELASIVLAAFTLDDYCRGRRFAARWLVLTALGWIAVLCVSVASARGLIIQLLHDQPHYPVILLSSLIAALSVAAVTVALLASRSKPPRSGVLGTILAAEAIGLFCFPLFAGARITSYDKAAVSFLRNNLGLSRFYALGVFRPNYGAFFETASIDHNYLPVPKLWVDYIRKHLDPAVVDVGFTGDYPEAGPGEETRLEALRARLPAYRAIGVKFVLVPAGADPFAELTAVTARPPSMPAIDPVPAGQSVSGVLAGSHIRTGEISQFAVTVGTFLGTADGVIHVRLCTARDCADGTAALANAPDNQPLRIRLAKNLFVRTGEALDYRIDHVGGDRAVAIYIWQEPKPPADVTPPVKTPEGIKTNSAPELFVGYADASPRPGLVYRDSLMDIYELADPAPYFDVQGAVCDITPRGREQVHAVCKTPARLIRHELFDAGWQAKLNGTSVNIAKTDEIFQGVALPSGHSEIQFSYAPPHIVWCYATLGIGLAWLMLGMAPLRVRTKLMGPLMMSVVKSFREDGLISSWPANSPEQK